MSRPRWQGYATQRQAEARKEKAKIETCAYLMSVQWYWSLVLLPSLPPAGSGMQIGAPSIACCGTPPSSTGACHSRHSGAVRGWPRTQAQITGALAAPTGFGLSLASQLHRLVLLGWLLLHLPHLLPAICAHVCQGVASGCVYSKYHVASKLYK